MGETIVGPPPAAVVACAREALAMVSEGFGPASTTGLQVATALVTGNVGDVEVRAIRAGLGRYDHGSVTAGLFGGPGALDWVDAHTLDVRVAATTQADLHALSVKLNAINHRFRDRVETVIAQSMRNAVRHATNKANQRARRASTYRMAAVRDDFTAGRCTDAVLAALDTDMHQLLVGVFDSTSDHIVSLFDRRQAERKRAIRQSGLDVTDAQLEAWEVEEDQRRDTLRGFVFGGLMGAATSLLANPNQAPAPLGEVARDLFAPPDVIAGTVRVADGAAITPSGHVTEPDGVALPNTFDYTDQLVTDLLAKNASGLTVTYEWLVGEPSRPFEPHQDLAGVQFTDDTWQVVCANPTDWPESTLLPGDHDGCQCDLDVFYADEGDAGEE